MLPAPPEPIRNNPLAQQKANLAMSNIIAVPLNKLTRSARNVRKSGGESIDELVAGLQECHLGSDLSHHAAASQPKMGSSPAVC
jgi:hypothetical protein